MLLPDLRFACGFASLLVLVFILECALSSLGTARRRNATACSRSLLSVAARATCAGLRVRRWCIRASYVYSSMRRGAMRAPDLARACSAYGCDVQRRAASALSEKRRRAQTPCGRARGVSIFLFSSSSGAFFLSFLTNWNCPPALCSSEDSCMFSSSFQLLKQACVLFRFETNTINSYLNLLLAGCVYIDILIGSYIQQLNQLFLNDEMLDCHSKHNS